MWIVVAVAICSPTGFGQSAALPGRDAADQTPRGEPRTRPQPPAKPELPEAQTPRSTSEHLTLKLQRGGRIAVKNRSGRTTINGWDGDTVEATAHGEPIEYQTDTETSHLRISISVPARGRGEVDLEIRVPRYAEIESADTRRGDVQISGVNGAISISVANGNVMLNRIGAAKLKLQNGDLIANDIGASIEARVFNGDTVVENAAGVVWVAAANGDIKVTNAEGGVEANSASGDIVVQCAKKRVHASATNGDVFLAGVAGDAEATTASGDVMFSGAIQAGGRYVLKSISGDVAMAIQGEPPGFTATLTTYNGEVETEFALKNDGPIGAERLRQRVTGRYGDGQAQILLDSFSGSARILKARGTAGTCK